jgi:LysR family nitrogen assimilation transcriptional regulator
MDFKQLQSFVRVAELGSFTKAAMALNVAQPVLSRQVRLLEVELRQNLLIRNGRGATLTDAGRLLMEHGRGILHQVARAKEEMGRVHGALAGQVALGLPPSLSQRFAVPLIRAFKRALPEAQLSIGEGLSTQMQEWLNTGRIDIAIVYGTTPNPTIELQPLTEESLVLLRPRQSRPRATQRRRVTLHQLAHEPMIMPSRPNAIRMYLENQMAQAGLKPSVVLEVDGISAILDLVLDGMGSALLPEHAVSRHGFKDQFQILDVCEPELRPMVQIATSAMRPATLTQLATVDLIQKTWYDMMQAS